MHTFPVPSFFFSAPRLRAGRDESQVWSLILGAKLGELMRLQVRSICNSIDLPQIWADQCEGQRWVGLKFSLYLGTVRPRLGLGFLSRQSGVTLESVMPGTYRRYLKEVSSYR